ncbi:carboxypeptidase regulatory-like domain-containing protein [Candidatus Saccharibacteria bacterium]|nr:MAG: carboxypeptidase regulatory-like domain-containing protein [Candidatus Saccharibacteria bacterium]
MHTTQKTTAISVITAAIIGLLVFALVQFSPSASAACAAQSSDYGSSTTTITVPTTGMYRVWSRMQVPDTINTSYLLEIDGGNCYTVSGNNLVPNTWTWVDSQNGSVTAKIDVSLAAGSHTLKAIGNKSGVGLDRIILTGDTACVPSSTGDNCAYPPDTTAPSVTITAPANGATVSGTVSVTVNAADDSGGSGIAKVELYVDSILKATSTATPYSLSLATANLSNASHSLTVKAYDKSNNVSTMSPAVNVTVQNGDSTSPTVTITTPQNGTTVGGLVNVAATATDNVGVTKIELYVDGMLKSSTNSYVWDTTATSNGSHSILARTYDATGNSATQTVQVTVQNGDTSPPSAPTGVTATATSSGQITVTWQTSTDNVGVHHYCLARNDGMNMCPGGTAMSYNDTAVLPSTTYTYRLTAFDAAGNFSAASTPAAATTPATPDTTAPAVPIGVTAVAISPTQINLTWQASTDNVGVAGYDVFRNGTKIASITTTSYGNTNLAASTSYTYTVVARDAAGNSSSPSVAVSATTLVQPSSTGTLTGVVSGANGLVSNAKVTFSFNGASHTYSTNSSGVYVAPDIPSGTYSARYSAKRYITQTKTVTVNGGEITTQNITLVRR